MLTAMQLLSRCVVALAIILHASLPVSAAGHSGDLDIDQIYCAPSGALSSSAASAAKRLLRILNEAPGDEEEKHSGHCSFCTVSALAVLPELVSKHCSLNYTVKRDVSRYEPGLVHRPHGPPLGSRSPPPLI